MDAIHDGPLFFKFTLLPETTMPCFEPFVKSGRPIEFNISVPPTYGCSSHHREAEINRVPKCENLSSFVCTSKKCSSSVDILGNIQPVYSCVGTGCLCSGSKKKKVTDEESYEESYEESHIVLKTEASMYRSTFFDTFEIDLSKPPPQLDPQLNCSVRIGRSKFSTIRIPNRYLSQDHCVIFLLWTCHAGNIEGIDSPTRPQFYGPEVDFYALESDSPTQSIKKRKKTSFSRAHSIQLALVDTSANGLWINGKPVKRKSFVFLFNGDILNLCPLANNVDSDELCFKVGLEPVFASSFTTNRLSSPIKMTPPAVRTPTLEARFCENFSQNHSSDNVSSTIVAMLDEWRHLKTSGDEIKVELDNARLTIIDLEENLRRSKIAYEEMNKTADRHAQIAQHYRLCLDKANKRIEFLNQELGTQKGEAEKCRRQASKLQFDYFAELNRRTAADATIKSLETDISLVKASKQKIVKFVECSLRRVTRGLVNFANEAESTDDSIENLIARYTCSSDTELFTLTDSPKKINDEIETQEAGLIKPFLLNFSGHDDFSDDSGTNGSHPLEPSISKTCSRTSASTEKNTTDMVLESKQKTRQITEGPSEQITDNNLISNTISSKTDNENNRKTNDFKCTMTNDISEINMTNEIKNTVDITREIITGIDSDEDLIQLSPFSNEKRYKNSYDFIHRHEKSTNSSDISENHRNSVSSAESVVNSSNKTEPTTEKYQLTKSQGFLDTFFGETCY